MKNAWIKAKVVDASDRNYSAIILDLLDRARREIVMTFYLIETADTAGPGHPVNRLAEALLRARARGVRLRITLNSNFRFIPKTDISRGPYFEKLLAAGAEILTLLPARRLHDKLIVIDKRWVVDGSMNWSVAALQQNYESVTVIDSPPHAAGKLARMEQISRPLPASERKSDRPFLPVPESIEVPAALFEKGKIPEMIAASDRRALILYLTLLGQAVASGKNSVELDLETAGKIFGLSANADRTGIRRQVLKVLRKLQSRYKLLESEFPYAHNARIRLAEIPGARVPLPGWLFLPDYLAKEEDGKIVLALAGEILKREGLSINSLSAPELERRFGIGKSTLVRARRGLVHP